MLAHVLMRAGRRLLGIKSATIATSTASTATALSSQRKIDRTSNGVLWSHFWNGQTGNATPMRFSFSTDDGATWTTTDSNAFGFAGTNGSAANIPSASFFIDLDDYAHVVYKDYADGNIYYRRGTPNAARTAWTWSGAYGLWTATTTANYPDIVAHREGTGWRAHVVFSRPDFGAKAYYQMVTITSGGAVSFDAAIGIGSGYSTGDKDTFPSIDFHHVGDGKTVKDGAPHIYMAWSSGGTGAGKGIRFRKGTYSGSAWYIGDEREIDSTTFCDDGAINTLYDGTRVLISASGLTSSQGIRVYERDAADTATVTRVNSTTGHRRGTISYDGLGNVHVLAYIDGRLYRWVWTRADGTYTGAYVEGSSANPYGRPSLKRGYSDDRIEFVWTNTTTSPYPVKFYGMDS